jgi:uncharacterized protein (DUF58 family)
MAGRERRIFPLVPRRRLTGAPFGSFAGRRRGTGSEVIGIRRYERGDAVSSIDWPASARLSTAHADDEFVVRVRAADQAPRVVLLVDRRPAMGLYPAPLPWLSKASALREATISIVASAAAARADIGAVDYAAGETWWLPPGRRDRPRLVADRAAAAPFDAPDDGVERGLALLGERRAELPESSFVFVLSDFLAPVGAESWRGAVARGWDVVPVVIQDPVWERSFPDAAGVGLPVVDARGGSVSLVRLGRGQIARRRAANERRYAALMDTVRALGLEPVELTTSDPLEIDLAFLAWAEERQRSRWAR